MVKIPSVDSLEKPDRLQDLLKQDKSDNCTLCRVIGAASLVGLGAYSFFSGTRQLEARRADIVASGARIGMRGRRVGVFGISLGLVYMGVWRWFN